MDISSSASHGNAHHLHCSVGIFLPFRCILADVVLFHSTEHGQMDL
jgi:hypothetical protein